MSPNNGMETMSLKGDRQVETLSYRLSLFLYESGIWMKTKVHMCIYFLQIHRCFQLLTCQVACSPKSFVYLEEKEFPGTLLRAEFSVLIQQFLCKVTRL